jgi:hypothetical protein
MLPNSCSPNSRAAWPVSWNWKLVVWWIGTATEPVVGSARWLPPCRARVSGLVQTGFDMLRLRILGGFFGAFPRQSSHFRRHRGRGGAARPLV